MGPPSELLGTVVDVSDCETYYLLESSLERMEERSHHCDTSHEVRDTCNSCVSDSLGGTLKEGSELLFHFFIHQTAKV